MTLNDIRVNADCQIIKGIGRKLDHIQASGRLSEVKDALKAVNKAAKDALARIEELENAGA